MLFDEDSMKLLKQSLKAEYPEIPIMNLIWLDMIIRSFIFLRAINYNHFTKHLQTSKQDNLSLIAGFSRPNELYHSLKLIDTLDLYNARLLNFFWNII